jgi:hypothetical protein
MYNETSWTVNNQIQLAIDKGQNAYKQCCWAKNISFGSGTTEPQIRIADPAPDSF